MGGISFSLVPRRREWSIGFWHFLCFAPAGFAFAAAVGFIQTKSIDFTWKLAVTALLTFVVTLWVHAVLEELFFRGVLQQILTRKLHSQAFGIVVTALIFGAAHLPFRHAFPNWRFAILAAIAGLFYGHAYAKAGSVRASMVTQAFVVTTWRVFLS
jgi:membrane protease YdiL (CAAX protease family)